MDNKFEFKLIRDLGVEKIRNALLNTGWTESVFPLDESMYPSLQGRLKFVLGDGNFYQLYKCDVSFVYVPGKQNTILRVVDGKICKIDQSSGKKGMFQWHSASEDIPREIVEVTSNFSLVFCALSSMLTCSVVRLDKKDGNVIDTASKMIYVGVDEHKTTRDLMNAALLDHTFYCLGDKVVQKQVSQLMAPLGISISQAPYGFSLNFPTSG